MVGWVGSRGWHALPIPLVEWHLVFIQVFSLIRKSRKLGLQARGNEELAQCKGTACGPRQVASLPHLTLGTELRLEGLWKGGGWNFLV